MRYFHRGALAVALAALAGCPAGQPPMPQTEAPPMAVGELAASTRFDVDPVRGAAFESGEAGGPLVVTATEVHHDLEAGRTGVTLAVPAPDADVGDLALAVDASRPLAAPAPRTLPAAGAAARLVTLWFDNPDATSFSLAVRLDGRVTAVPKRHVAAVGAITATATSSLAGFAPTRAVDGDPMTQWTNATYREAQASLTLDLGTVQTVSAVKLKMRPFSGGARYTLETSADGAAFTAASGPLKNTTWTVETKALTAPVQARYVRVHCVNDAMSPETRFEVYDAGVAASAPTGATPPPPLPTPTPPVGTPTPPPPPPAASGSLLETFEGVPAGGAPSTFVDPLDEGYSFSWMPRVRWHVETLNGSKQFIHDGFNTRALLSFRRYRGTALGANGQLPARYFAQVAVTPQKSGTLAPTGDQGTQVYYLDPTHYVELLIKPTLFEVWQCNNGVPFSSAGWSRLYFSNVSTAANQRRVLGALVDTNAHSLTAYLDGTARTTQGAALLQNKPHWLALRGTGNVVGHDDLRIEPR